MSHRKDYFLAGLAVEEATEQRDRARANLRDAAAKACPDELRKLDEATDALKTAEARLGHVMVNMMNGPPLAEMQEAANRWAEEHARTCDQPQCPIKQAMNRAVAAGVKLN